METSIALHFQANAAAVRCELDGVVEQLPQDLTDAAYAAQLAFVQWAGNLHAGRRIGGQYATRGGVGQHHTLYTRHLCAKAQPLLAQRYYTAGPNWAIMQSTANAAQPEPDNV